MSQQPIILPTTQAQVSGHRFLMRRIEHGVVLGDIRMIHDPLGRRARAAVFGLVACVLLCIGAGALALFAPRIDPGQAPIVVAESGALFVRIDDRLHPVANLTSAQLITGAPERPAQVSNEILADIPRGIPIGLIDAPGVIDSSIATDLHWSACANDIAIEVWAQQESFVSMPGGTALLVETMGNTFFVTSSGRQLLPSGDTPEGRVVRRRLGITNQTPVWRLAPEMLNTILELPPVAIPARGQIWTTDAKESYLLHDDAIIQLTDMQRDMLLDLGFSVEEVNRSSLNNIEDATPLLELPAHAPKTWVEPKGQFVCTTGDEATIAIVEPKPGGVDIQEGLRYRGPGVSIPIDTGHGWIIVSDHGRRYGIPDEETLRALSSEKPIHAPWPVVRLLPEGPSLNRELALEPLFGESQ
ncbi:type VII secretion protein EccB [Corynebacterium freiburgense]|uniref:type VII secretion protein EccB n=1 Tax=Corynebacterium freiburgense TaxID=556548 RepID=UPI00040642FB|nr:type VII secretion protein EccB [Corynebacterium freiburgense]WJZ01699.1 ESX-1 secretion system protein eccB1 [Corynebacterium freiburgense]